MRNDMLLEPVELVELEEHQDLPGRCIMVKVGCQHERVS